MKNAILYVHNYDGLPIRESKSVSKLIAYCNEKGYTPCEVVDLKDEDMCYNIIASLSELSKGNGAVGIVETIDVLRGSEMLFLIEKRALIESNKISIENIEGYTYTHEDFLANYNEDGYACFDENGAYKTTAIYLCKGRDSDELSDISDKFSDFVDKIVEMDYRISTTEVISLDFPVENTKQLSQNQLKKLRELTKRAEYSNLILFESRNDALQLVGIINWHNETKGVEVKFLDEPTTTTLGELWLEHVRLFTNKI